MLKKTGRIGVILFAIILVFSLVVFTGCGRAQLKGSDIRVASFWSTYNVDTYEPRDEAEAEGLQLRRRLMAEHGFNLEVFELSDYDSYLSMVASHMMARDKNIHIYEVTPDMAVTLFKQGLLAPISNATSVNLKNRNMVAYELPMYNAPVEQYMTFGGVQYGWSYSIPNNGWGQAMLFFNTRHLVDVGLSPDYLYDLQRDNNWTWATFLDLCRRLTRDTTGDGVIDVYAVPFDDAREVLRGLIYGNGGNFVTFDANGVAHSAVNSPAVIEALNFYNQLINENLMLTINDDYGPNWGWNWSAFADGRVAMTFDPEWRKGQMNEGFDAGYVLPPRGPRSDALRLDTIDSCYVIPAFYSPAEVEVFLKAFELWNTPTTTDWL